MKSFHYPATVYSHPNVFYSEIKRVFPVYCFSICGLRNESMNKQILLFVRKNFSMSLNRCWSAERFLKVKSGCFCAVAYGGRRYFFFCPFLLLLKVGRLGGQLLQAAFDLTQSGGKNTFRVPPCWFITITGPTTSQQQHRYGPPTRPKLITVAKIYKQENKLNTTLWRANASILRIKATEICK